MGRPYHFLLPLLSIFLVRVDLTDFYSINLETPELKVLDGDTVQVKLGGTWHRLRVGLIDAPERGQIANGTDLGEYSANCLRRSLKKPWIVRIDGFDLYGRVLGDINGVSLSMIRQGCAYLYPYSRFSSVRQKGIYRDQVLKARRQKIGLWKFKVLNPYFHRRSKPKFQ